MSVKKIIILLVIITFHVKLVPAQGFTQTLKGTVADKESQITLPGANVVILNTDPLLGTITDPEGQYKIENVPVGRYDIQISYLGYEPVTIPEIMVGTGKEVVINAGLKESVAHVEEVVIKAHARKETIYNTPLIYLVPSKRY